MGKAAKLKPQERKGLVIVITGPGKGKTTAALGMALRAVGHHMKVCIIQFMKGELYTGEWDGIKKLGEQVELIAMGKGFYRPHEDSDRFAEHRKRAQEALGLAREKMVSGEFDILILDEVNNALHLGLVDLAQVLMLIRRKPAQVHLIFTGRNAHPEIVSLADTVSEIMDVKHAHARGIPPQPGIDY